MNKSDFIAELSSRLGSTKVAAASIFEQIFDADSGIIAAALANGEDVSIVGFGKFATRTRAARTARNPKTGESIQVAARRVARFSPGKQISETVNAN